MSKEEKKLDLKPIAKKERELKSWVGPQRPFVFPVFRRTAVAAAAFLCVLQDASSYAEQFRTASCRIQTDIFAAVHLTVGARGGTVG